MFHKDTKPNLPSAAAAFGRHRVLKSYCTGVKTIAVRYEDLKWETDQDELNLYV